MKRILFVNLILFSFSLLLAQGRIIIPEPPVPVKYPPIDLKKIDAKVNIKGSVGDITLEQIFYNESVARLEGEYIFAIPDEAQVHDFYLYIDGKKTRGEVLDAKEAFNTYMGIVRKMRDPALLEYSGCGLFKARIFPIEPKSDRKIELSYAQILKYDGANYRFILPIRQSGQGSIDQFHMEINLSADLPVVNIYSPSHDIQISHIDAKNVKITLEANDLEGSKDFLLYYSLGRQEIGGSLLTFRPRTDRDGYFIFMANPQFEIHEKKYVPKDVVFVVDVSGSMQGEKIEQAKEALRFCIGSLRKNDQFEIISFSSAVQSFQGHLQIAGQDNIENARYFIDNLYASGGTNINEALATALKLKKQGDERPTSIVFLTDGLPTEGITEVKNIVQNVSKINQANTRIFNFGVGYDVNTFLLDKLAEDSHGSSNYVKPGENIEQEVSHFFAKISSPILTNIEIDFGDAKTYDIYPQKFSQIFQGQRLTIIGRYRTPGKSQLKLTGLQSGKKKEYSYNLEFLRREKDNEFIAKLWANRKVVHLLSQIRFQGENPELIESIKALGKEYGIVTPYTSFLVTEQEKELAVIHNQVSRGVAGASAVRMKSAQVARESKSELDEESVGSSVFYDAMSAAPPAADKSFGKGAVLSSRAMKKIGSSDRDIDMILTIKRVGDKSFQLQNGVWIEQTVDVQTPADRIITFLSDEYFELIKNEPELKRIIAIGEQLKFEWKGKIIQINTL